MALLLSRRVSGWTITLLIAAALSASSCHPRVSDPHDPNFIVAQHGDWTITRGQLDHELAGYFKEHQLTAAQVGPTNMPALETAMLRNMVMEKLLLTRAKTMQLKDIDKDDADAFQRIKGRFPTEQAFEGKLKQAGITVDDLKKRIDEQVLIEKLFEADAVHNPDPTDKEITDFYLGHKDLFNVPLKLRASRILVMVPEKATPEQKAAKKKIIDAARAKVAKGADFSTVATTVSEDHYSAPRGGDIGYFQRGENEPGFDEVAFSSKIGVLSPVFETPLGYQFVKVTEIKPAGTLPLDDARSVIAQNLRRMKVAQQEEAYTKKLMDDSKVQYNIPLTEPPAETTATNAAPGEEQAPPPAAPEPAETTNAAPATH